MTPLSPTQFNMDALPPGEMSEPGRNLTPAKGHTSSRPHPIIDDDGDDEENDWVLEPPRMVMKRSTQPYL